MKIDGMRGGAWAGCCAAGVGAREMPERRTVATAGRMWIFTEVSLARGGPGVLRQCASACNPAQPPVWFAWNRTVHRRRFDGAGGVAVDRAEIRGNHSSGPLVGAAAGGVPRAVDLHCLFHLGGVPGDALRIRPLPLPFLFTAALRRQRSRVVRAETGVVARRAPFFGSAPDPLGARGFPVHLLLLPGRVLQGVLGGPAVVHGW